jgi:sorbitol-specific phosphotransferase system component IIA
MSVITGIRSVDVDLDLKGWEHIFTGATRILIGVIGAVIIGLALDSGLVNFSFGSGSEEETPGSIKVAKHLAMILIFSFIAGFSESLVPSIMRRGEQAVGTDRSHTPDDPIVKDTKP